MKLLIKFMKLNPEIHILLQVFVCIKNSQDWNEYSAKTLRTISLSPHKINAFALVIILGKKINANTHTYIHTIVQLGDVIFKIKNLLLESMTSICN